MTKVSENMTTGQLIEAHNRIAPTPLRSWKRSKRELVLRIEDLEPKRAAKGAVVARVLELLAYVGPDGRGLSPREIASTVRRELGGRTSEASVRWYLSKARAGRFGALELPDKRRRS